MRDARVVIFFRWQTANHWHGPQRFALPSGHQARSTTQTQVWRGQPVNTRRPGSTLDPVNCLRALRAWAPERPKSPSP